MRPLIQPQLPTPRRGGFTLLEVLVYIGVWTVVVGAAFTLFYRAMSGSKRLARSADDVVLAIQAGERWRADVRRLSGAPEWLGGMAEDGRVLRLPVDGGGVWYRMTRTNVLRQAAADGPWVEVVRRVRRSEMVRDERDGVVSWRWELELGVEDIPMHVRPLLTFQAVPGGGRNR